MLQKPVNVLTSKEMEEEWTDAQDAFSVLYYVKSESTWYGESYNRTKV